MKKKDQVIVVRGLTEPTEHIGFPHRFAKVMAKIYGTKRVTKERQNNESSDNR